MNSNVNSTNSAPYITSDRTELAPLCSSQQDTKGLRVIISFLTVFTVLISLALMTQLHHGDYQVVPHGSVVSDYKDCSTAGVTIMKKGGSAVDAVISSLFCMSVVFPHLVGIGGGGYMLAYDQRKREVVLCLDFQPEMSSNHSQGVGVPGFVAGLYEAHRLQGRLPWAELLNAAIEIAGSGFTVSASLMSAVSLAADHPQLKELLTSGLNPRLFSTLKTLALNGSDGTGPQSLVVDSACTLSPYVTLEDLSRYHVVADTCQSRTVGRYNIAVMGSGSGGPMLLHLLDNVLDEKSDHVSVADIVMRLKETMVVSRPYSSGVNVVATDHNDIYVSAVSGLGSVLGSMQLTPGGYLLNNVFSSSQPGSDNRPSTLYTPVIITQTGIACGNRIITGASDVRDAAQLVVDMLEYVTAGGNGSLQSVSETPRVRVSANQVLLEKNHKPLLDPAQQMLLTQWNFSIGIAPEPYPSLNFIHKIGDVVTPVADSRGGGSPDSF